MKTITLDSKADVTAFWEDVAQAALEYVALGLEEGQFGVPYDMAPDEMDQRYLAQWLADRLERWIKP